MSDETLSDLMVEHLDPKAKVEAAVGPGKRVTRLALGQLLVEDCRPDEQAKEAPKHIPNELGECPSWCELCRLERAARERAAATLRTTDPQPPPDPNGSQPVWDLVIEDMRQRDADGRRKYGVPLQAHNGRDALVDAYQEALDLVVYLRQAIAERDAKKGSQP